MKSMLAKSRILGKIIPACFLLACSFRPAPGADKQSAQTVVDSLTGLIGNLTFPEHFRQGDFIRARGDFDINAYFSILTHLSMEPGWILDYVYFMNGLGGQPLIYARRLTDKPFGNYDEFVKTVGGSQKPPFQPFQHAHDYLRHIRIDTTAAGFFQFVLLYTMGDQFYLFWHGGYNDMRIVCDRQAADLALSATEKQFQLKIPPKVRQAAQKIDFEPEVDFVGNSAKVRFITFTKWGGFAEMKCSISRTFPHAISNWQKKVVVPYDCGVNF